MKPLQPVSHIRFGSLWTNIPADSFRALGVDSGDFVRVSIRENGKLRYQNQMPFTRIFAGVSVGEPLVYVNSLLNIGVAVNQACFARTFPRPAIALRHVLQELFRQHLAQLYAFLVKGIDVPRKALKGEQRDRKSVV